MRVATWKSNYQNSVNNIKNEIWDLIAKDCDYMIIQDDYDADNNTTALTTTN